ncbi:nucleoprotein TPR isoform X2 [Aricia agestis]|uniref:nucleoprotein TPR isoform X2 n=1 Tax=Aricia agestis TaxID=91739 RepID=UPI001C20BA22|nr:nucleoprotein TPR isoform X2 [Aricia agestis]
MEAASVETGDKNHLNNVLSGEEIATIPNTIANKINCYIDQKFEEYLTSKALHESSKSQIDDKFATTKASIIEFKTKYEETAKKLLVAEDTISNFEKQVGTLNTELERARDKISRLENEIITLKSARDAAVDERNDLTRILERRDKEIERLTSNETSLSQQLRAAIDAKCEALALNDEIQSKELSLQYREKRLDQERVLLNSQIAGLTEEVNRLTTELQTMRLNNTSRLVGLETQLAEKIEELNAANDTIAQLNETKKNLNNRAENLTQRLLEQREVENKMSENYKKELDAKTKLADLFKTMHDDAEAKTTELSEGITELQKLLNEATEKYGELETKYKQAEQDQEELLEKKNEIISSLKNELEHANDLLKAATQQNLDMALGDLAPSAATASKLLKSGMSLTQIYSQLVKVTDELSQEKEENRRLNITINKIVQELEEKVPLLQKQKAEYVEAMESNAALTQQIDSLVIECNRLRDDYNESSKIANHFTRENSRLKGELADLGRQVCFLLKEIEHNRGALVNGDHDASNANTSSSDTSSSRIISKTLVTFSDIQELQSNNQKLLRMIRELTDKQEELERHKEQFESGEMESKIDGLKQRVTELTEAQERQTKMVNGLIRQRDMFKKLYHDLMKGKRHEMSSVLDPSELDKNESMQMDVTPERTFKQTNVEPSAFEIKFKETEKQLELLREEYKTYKEEKVTNERMLFDQIDNMRQEISKLTAANSKCASTSEYNNERLKILQTNINTYKKQISSLEDKNKAYSSTIAKHEVSLQHLRDEILNSQGKLAAAEIQVENLKLENKLLKDTELRLQTEKEIVHRERQGQSILLQNLELIKASLERVEVENKAKIESRLDEATRECSALRRRLQEEQDRFRELASHLERQTDIAKSRMQEEKDAADLMRKEIQQLRDDLVEKGKNNEELTKKLKMSLAPCSDQSLDAIKKIKELEIKLTEKTDEIKALLEQLATAKEHIKQYCDISEGAEKELKILHKEYEDYKSETEVKLSDNAQRLKQLEDKCSELEAEISLQSNGDSSNTSSAVNNELLRVKEELKNALANFDKCREELDSARSEVANLSEAVQKAEEKYTHEMILHSTDIQTLSQVKEDLLRAQNQLNEMVAMKNSTLEKLETEKLAWIDREKILLKENEQLAERLKDLNSQNSLLHDQIQALGTQLSVSHASRSQSESMIVNDSANDSSINVSVSEDDGKSSEQLFQIVKFLRKEKDIAMAKFDILQAETMRLRSQLEITEKQLDDCKLTLASEREKSEVNMVTVNRQSDILRKVETLNALTDSNRILREERDTLTTRVEELTNLVRSLEEQLTPLQEKISDISSQNETLQSENTSLKADCARWRTRVNALVERANKTSPEDWKRLQNERETLAKMLTNEKESVKKVHDELSLIKIEKSKIEEQYTLLSRQQNSLIEENKKLNEELHTLKDDMARLTEELTRIKSEHNSLTELHNKLTEELSSKDASLADIRNKELQIRKIAKKYKGQYEELVKTVEEEKKKTEGDAAAGAALAESSKKIEEELNEIKAQLEAEKSNNDKLKQELETLRTANTDKEEKAKQVLKQAKSKIVQLTELKNNLSRELDESRSKIDSIEQATRGEQDVRLALIKSQYEGRLSRLEKERGEVQAEKSREVEALLQKVNMLQRQLANQSSGSKQQTTTEKTTTDPPTANIKPMAGVAQQSVSASRRGGETPLASIRPMAQVGPTAPHDAHSTEYMPASSSRPLPRAISAASAAPPESTQDMDTSEAGMGSSGTSDSTAQSSSHSQPPQQAVALVMPRIEQPSGASAAPAASSAQPQPAPAAQPPAPPSTPGAGATSASPSGSQSGVSTSHAAPLVSTSQTPPGVSTSHTTGVTTTHSAPGVSTSHTAAGVSTSAAAAGPGVSTSQGAAGPGVSTSQGAAGPGVSTSAAAPGVSTSHPPPGDARPQKRRLQSRPVTAKRTRGFERSVEVEYQVPTSSRCDQDDEGVIVVDSEEDDERCTGTMYREGEEDEEDMEEEQEVEGEEEEEAEADDSENVPPQESPAQSPEAGEAAMGEEAGEGADIEAPPAPHQQIEAISSGTEPSGALSLGGSGGDDADDSIVPSTPTLYVPRRNDGFGEAVVSPVGGVGGAGAAAEGGARFTFAEAGGAASHHDTHPDLAAALPPAHPPQRPEGEGQEWEESRGEEESAAVSSQGSEPSSPQQVAEEGREAEASAAPRRAPPTPQTPHSPHQRWMRAADSDSGARGRGMRRGRPSRRSHYMRY